MAVFPVSSGYADYSGTMIPEIWSPRLLVKFYLATVFGAIANTDYEDEIQNMGDTIHIRTTPTITIKPYVKGQKLEHEVPEPNVVDLLIDKGDYWAFKDDDVDRVQADYAYIDDWTNDAAMQQRIYVDNSILSTVYTDAHASNKGTTAGAISGSFDLGTTGSPVQIDKTNVVEYIQDCSSVLTEQNVPQEDRWFVAPEWFINLIGKSDLKDASLSGDAVSIARNGRVGMVGMFEIYLSNQIALTTDGANSVSNIIFGHKSAITFASQLIKNEGPMRHPDFFGSFYRGLQVYGFDVLKAEALGHLYAYK